MYFYFSGRSPSAAYIHNYHVENTSGVRLVYSMYAKRKIYPTKTVGLPVQYTDRNTQT